MRMGITDVIGSTPSTTSTATSDNWSTKARMALRSPLRCSISSSAMFRRARWAMRRTVSASTDMTASRLRKSVARPIASARLHRQRAGAPAPGPRSGRFPHAIVIPGSTGAVVPARGSADIWRMDAPNPSAVPTFANRTPLHIGGVGLVVRDLEKVAEYYRHLLGVSELARDGGTVRLGAGGVPFLELTERPDARPDDAREAGLHP